jgi:hypothetical protein
MGIKKWLLIALATMGAGGMTGCKADAAADGNKVGKQHKKSPLKAIRALLLAAFKPAAYANDVRAAGKIARTQLTALLDPLVAAKELSRAGADRLLVLHEECTAHALRSMASCYEPMPMDWVDWEWGGGAREKACKRIDLLDKLTRTGKLEPAAAEKSKAEIAAGLATLEQLRAFLGETDQKKKATLKKTLLDGKSGESPDEATREAAGFILRLFEKRG